MYYFDRSSPNKPLLETQRSICFFYRSLGISLYSGKCPYRIDGFRSNDSLIVHQIWIIKLIAYYFEHNFPDSHFVHVAMWPAQIQHQLLNSIIYLKIIAKIFEYHSDL